MPEAALGVADLREERADRRHEARRRDDLGRRVLARDAEAPPGAHEDDREHDQEVQEERGRAALEEVAHRRARLASAEVVLVEEHGALRVEAEEAYEERRALGGEQIAVLEGAAARDDDDAPATARHDDDGPLARDLCEHLVLDAVLDVDEAGEAKAARCHAAERAARRARPLAIVGVVSPERSRERFDGVLFGRGLVPVVALLGAELDDLEAGIDRRERDAGVARPCRVDRRRRRTRVGRVGVARVGFARVGFAGVDFAGACIARGLALVALSLSRTAVGTQDHAVEAVVLAAARGIGREEPHAEALVLEHLGRAEHHPRAAGLDPAEQRLALGARHRTALEVIAAADGDERRGHRELGHVLVPAPRLVAGSARQLEHRARTFGACAVGGVGEGEATPVRHAAAHRDQRAEAEHREHGHHDLRGAAHPLASSLGGGGRLGREAARMRSASSRLAR
jgi:hypothetical protein